VSPPSTNLLKLSFVGKHPVTILQISILSLSCKLDFQIQLHKVARGEGGIEPLQIQYANLTLNSPDWIGVQIQLSSKQSREIGILRIDSMVTI